MGGGFISRGFRGRRRSQDTELPSGQYLVDGFPVLSAGPTPHTPLEEWDFSIVGDVDEPKNWTWEEFRALPAETITRDIHCVTKWSKLDTVWEGVAVDTLLEGVETAAEYVVAFSDGGYTTNLPLADVTGGKAWVVYAYDGEPLAPEHGGPARLLVPHLYFWKSAKWIRGLQLTRRTTARLLGVAGLPQLRGRVARAALPGGLSGVATAPAPRPRWRLATLVEADAGDAPGHQPGAGRARLGGAPPRPARGRAPHGRGRLPGPAQLLHRLAPGGRSARPSPWSACRTARCRPTWWTTCARATSWSSGAPSGATSCGRPRWGGPLLLVAGGSGDRAPDGHAPPPGGRGQRRARAPAVLLPQLRGDHLPRGAGEPRGTGRFAGGVHTLTRSSPGWTGYGRVDAQMLAEVAWAPAERPQAFVCGPTGLVEAVAAALVDLGHEPARVKTERFGATGG